MSDARDIETQSMDSHCATDKPEKPLRYPQMRAAARLSKNQVEPKTYHAAAPLV